MLTVNLKDGLQIKLQARFIRNDRPIWDDRINEVHPHFKVTVWAKGNKHTFDFWDSVDAYCHGKTELEDWALLDALACFISDAAAYDANRNYADFCAAFGYREEEDAMYAKPIFRECRKAFEHYMYTFGQDWTIGEQIDELISNYN